MGYFLIFTLQCLFPIFDGGDGHFNGLSIVNTDNQAQTFTVAVTEGSRVQAGIFVLQPGAQRSGLLHEIVPNAPASGWIRVGSNLGYCTTYMTTGTDDVLTGMEGAPAPPQSPVPPLDPPVPMTLILPHVFVNTGFTELDHTDTRIALINSTFPAAAVTAQLFGKDGALRGSVSLTVQPARSLIVQVSQIFQSVLPNNSLGGKTFDGYIRLLSNTQIGAWQRIETPVSAAVLRGRTLEESYVNSLATIPHFLFSDDYASLIDVLNPATTPLNLELIAYNDRGSRLGDVVQLRLAPGELRRSSVAELFRIAVPAIFPAPVVAGHITIRDVGSQPFQVAGSVKIVNLSHGSYSAMMLSAISVTGSTQWMMPFAVASGEYFTGYAIANPNALLTVQTDVQLEVVSPNGSIQSQSTIQLSPLNRRIALAPNGVAGGYIRFKSNFPIHVMGSIGTTDLRTIDQIPVIRQ
jgi:hypothetical protein